MFFDIESLQETKQFYYKNFDYMKKIYLNDSKIYLLLILKIYIFFEMFFVSIYNLCIKLLQNISCKINCLKLIILA